MGIFRSFASGALQWSVDSSLQCVVKPLDSLPYSFPVYSVPAALMLVQVNVIATCLPYQLLLPLMGTVLPSQTK